MASRKLYPLLATLTLIDGGRRVRVETARATRDSVLHECVMAFTWGEPLNERADCDVLIQTRSPLTGAPDPKLSECYIRTPSGALLLTPAPLPTLRNAVHGMKLERGQALVLAFEVEWPAGVDPRAVAGSAAFKAQRAAKQINVEKKEGV